jgi:hypothetical protein
MPEDNYLMTADGYWIVEPFAAICGSADDIASNAQVFHYTSKPVLESIVRHGELWATDFRFLNDFSELTFAWDLITRRLLIKRMQVDELNDHILAIGRMLFEDPHAFVVSFSTDDDDLGQWRAYSSRCGVAIGFSEEIFPWDSFNSSGMCMRHVEYDPQIHIGMCDPIVEVLAAELARRPLSNSRYREIASVIMDIFWDVAPFIKHPAFRGEKEVRLLYRGNTLTVERRQRGSQIIPFVRISYRELHRAARTPTHPIWRMRIAPNSGIAGERFGEINTLMTEHGDQCPIVHYSMIPMRWPEPVPPPVFKT